MILRLCNLLFTEAAPLHTLVIFRPVYVGQYAKSFRLLIDAYRMEDSYVHD